MLPSMPSWIRRPLVPWFKSRLAGYWNELVSPILLIRFQLEMQQDYGFGPNEVYFDVEVREFLETCSDDTFINFLDYMLVYGDYEEENAPHSEETDIEFLEQVLSDSGSKWSVMQIGEDYRIVERIPEGVANSMEEALSGSDAAARKLQEAWLDAFGKNPRASIAYYTAVVAVENAALAVMPVNHPEPQLSTLFSILEADDPKWQLTLRDYDKAPGAKSLAAMLRTLLRGHDSRHGAKEYEDVSIEQARAAVMLAATLVWWFRSGIVVPANS